MEMDSMGDSETNRILERKEIDTPCYTFLIDGSYSESPAEKKSRIRSIYILYLSAMMKPLIYYLSDISQLQYLESVSTTVNNTTSTWLFAALIISELVCTPLFGYWTDKFRQTRWPLMFTHTLDLIAVLLNCYAAAFPAPSEYVLLASRILMGICDASLCVSLAYFVAASTLEERSKVIIRFQVARHAGGLLAPILQQGALNLGYPGILNSPFLQLNMYTIPFFVVAILQILELILLGCCFKEHRIVDVRREMYELEDEHLHEATAPIYYSAAAVCVYSGFVRTTILSLVEGMTALLLRDMYGFNKEDTTKITSYSILGFLLLLSIALFVILKTLTKAVEDRHILLGASVACCIGVFLLLPWGNTYAEQYYYNTSINGFNSSQVTDSTDVIGCIYDWCGHVPVIPVPQIITAAIICAVSLTGFDASATALFSKILGSDPQGKSMSVFDFFTSLGRITGKLGVMKLYIAFGQRVAFSIQLSLCVILLVAVIATYKYLIPQHSYTHKAKETYKRLTD